MNRRIGGFDGLRGIAFLLVFVSHKTSIAYNERYGDVGVWLFFVLSGFLITRILAEARATIERGDTRVSQALKRFYWRRTTRIFPIYYLVLGFFTVCAFFVQIGHFGLPERLAYWLYATNLLVEHRSAWVGDFGHFWSLAIEEQFYLLFAPIVLLAPRAHTQTVCIAFVVVGLLTKAALEMAGASWISVDVDSFVNFTLLAWGGIVGLSATRSLPRWFAGTPASVGLFLFYLALPTIVGPHMHVWSVFGKLSAVLGGAILLQIFRNQDGAFVKALDSAPLRGLGRISYGAYLFHPFIHLHTVQRFLQDRGIAPGLAKLAQLSAELAATVLLAAVSWRYVEQPVLDRAARGAATRANAAASGAV